MEVLKCRGNRRSRRLMGTLRDGRDLSWLHERRARQGLTGARNLF
jgi:hypothetical protein